ncbi:PREDICTED: uncharacterized protein LOC106745203 [Dinoponera quadriceps]|uniref:Uncharacterized protein LOC106745203 n=1 Tax=Dinoponera quadriceps TaxID=609295 RepID=A0A6P3XDX4_DINQU|nr:PREDICTED: uncharacterized protein LOC106745203 [Dinoponera quadriceps]
MKLSIGVAILCVLVVALLSGTTYARPASWFLSRQKRLSDQRIAELDTLIALEKLKGYIVPVGLGKLDPAVIGRRRRSVPEDDLRKLQRLLLIVGQDQFRPSPWKEDSQEVQGDY